MGRDDGDGHAALREEVEQLRVELLRVALRVHKQHRQATTPTP